MTTLEALKAVPNFRCLIHEHTDCPSSSTMARKFMFHPANGWCAKASRLSLRVLEGELQVLKKAGESECCSRTHKR
jgi:hypothetical protein